MNLRELEAAKLNCDTEDKILGQFISWVWLNKQLLTKYMVIQNVVCVQLR